MKEIRIKFTESEINKIIELKKKENMNSISNALFIKVLVLNTSKCNLNIIKNE